jgi:hypothetical protein
MTARSMLPDKPPPKVRNSWRCVRRGPLVEVVRRLPSGDALVVLRCVECDATDLAERVRAATECGGPT